MAKAPKMLHSAQRTLQRFFYMSACHASNATCVIGIGAGVVRRDWKASTKRKTEEKKTKRYFDFSNWILGVCAKTRKLTHAKQVTWAWPTDTHIQAHIFMCLYIYMYIRIWQIKMQCNKLLINALASSAFWRPHGFAFAFKWSRKFFNNNK